MTNRLPRPPFAELVARHARPGEEWRQLAEFHGYAVSSLGRVMRSGGGAGTRAGLVLKEQKDAHGYPMYALWINGKRHGKKAHALVALAFLGPMPTGMEVAHNDGDRANPRLSNIRYATRKENHADKRRHGTHICGSKVPWSRLREGDVPVIRLMRASGLTVQAIADKYNVHRETIGMLLRGKSWAWL